MKAFENRNSKIENSSAAYSSTPLWKKLGYKPGLKAYLEGAPDSYIELLRLPSEAKVKWVKKPVAGIDFVHLFTASKPYLETRLRSLRQTIAPSGTIWISWPKKASGVTSEVSEDLVREIGLPLGFVDVKVCAVDETWSALKLVIRKVNR